MNILLNHHSWLLQYSLTLLVPQELEFPSLASSSLEPWPCCTDLVMGIGVHVPNHLPQDSKGPWPEAPGPSTK